MKYDTDKNKLVMLPVELKDKLDKVILMMVKQKIENGDTKLKVSYSDAIKYILELSNVGV